MARGNFFTSLYASLSRAQIDFGGPATFGLEVSQALETYKPNPSSANPVDPPQDLKGSSFNLGNMIERGCFNYRWPVTEYYLDLRTDSKIPAPDLLTPVEEKHVGTCTMFSCSEGDVFYQVLRIDEGGHVDGLHGCRHFPEDSQVLLTIGGPVWFHTFGDTDRFKEHVRKRGHMQLAKTFNTGGSNEEPTVLSEQEPEPVDDESYESPNSSKEQPIYETVRYRDGSRNIGLEMRVYQLDAQGEPKLLPLTRSEAEADNGVSGAQSKLTAYNAVGKIAHRNHFEVHQKHTSATFISVIRFYEGENNDSGDWPELGTSLEFSKKLYDYVGVDPSVEHATGAMWETIFLEREQKADSISELAEVGLVGRCLEKILQVDTVQASFTHSVEKGKEVAADPSKMAVVKRKIPAEIALVSNLYVRSNVDLKALL